MTTKPPQTLAPHAAEAVAECKELLKGTPFENNQTQRLNFASWAVVSCAVLREQDLYGPVKIKDAWLKATTEGIIKTFCKNEKECKMVEQISNDALTVDLEHLRTRMLEQSHHAEFHVALCLILLNVSMSNDDKEVEEKSHKDKEKEVIPGYASYDRILLHELATGVGFDVIGVVELIERPMAYIILEQNTQLDAEAMEEARKKSKSSKLKRGIWTGIGAVGGAIALGVTGGLAAPLVIPALGLFTAGLATTLLAGTTGIVVVTSIFGATGAGMAGFRVHRRAKDLDVFEFRLVNDAGREIVHEVIDHEDGSKDSSPKSPQTPTLPLPEKPLELPYLSVTITVPGFTTKDDLLTFPKANAEHYWLDWEPKALRDVGNALEKFVTTELAKTAGGEVLKRTVFGAIMSAVAIPYGLVKIASLIDNPWGRGLDLAKKAGALLAEALLQRTQGNRPVTLIGYSLGAAAVAHCLAILDAKVPEGSPPMVEHAYLLGSPVSIAPEVWFPLRRAVAGRLVNVYSSTDWVLSFLHRTAYQAFGQVAGCVEIDVEGVENIDASKIVKGHTKYEKRFGEVLEFVETGKVSRMFSTMSLGSPQGTKERI